MEVNVIDSKVFARLNQNLLGVQKSAKVLRMANGILVPSEATWTGTVHVGGTSSTGTFQVFDSGGAWDMLFGKPLLATFGASHAFRNDVVTLCPDGSDVCSVIKNANSANIEGSQNHEVAVAQVSDLGGRSVGTPMRWRQVRNFIAHHEFGNSLFVIPETVEEGDINTTAKTEILTGAGPCQTAHFLWSITEIQTARAIKKAMKSRLCRLRQLKRRKIAAELQLVWSALAGSCAARRTPLERNILHVRTRRKIIECRALRAWENTPWDFGTADRGVAVPDEEEGWFEEKMCVGGGVSRKATVEDCLDSSAEGIRKTKVAVASASNPGAHMCEAPLRHREVEKIAMTVQADQYFEQVPGVMSVEETETYLEETSPGTEQPEIRIGGDKSIFTRSTHPFKEARVAEILRLVEIGSDVTPVERRLVEDTIAEFADTYALSVSEVKHIPGAIHRLEIPEGATFNTKIRQKPMSPPQTEYFLHALDVMLDAGICEPIAAKDVKCVSPITLAAKAHSSGGMTIEELRQRLNKECANVGVKPPFIVPENAPPLPNLETADEPQKWRVCTNYMRLNELTHVLQMPQGDIRTKQQALSGHRWISMFDFAAGFYAVEIAEESRPYTAFYVEGRGYFAYRRMPFGLTGAPSCFNEVTARALHGLVGTMIQLFVDDGAMAGDIFEEKLANLRIFLTRCREESLSLSPQKTKLFMSEVVFAGERIGSNGIQADLTKLTAVVNWETPRTIQNLEAFLGLTGYFRPLIKNYSLLERPLKDLANTLSVPKGAGKQAYRNAAHAVLR
jgi:Reverse transcriptase (RNA-dependent DNA polymerase)